MKVLPIMLGIGLLASACTAAPVRTEPRIPPESPAQTDGASPSGTQSPSLPSPVEAEPHVFLPEPDRPVPADPEALADELTTVTDALADSIDAWTSDGDPSKGGPPEAVELQALYRQRIVRALGNQKLREATIPRLPRRLRGPAKAVAVAGQKLRSLVTPISGPSGFHTGPPQPAGVLLRFFKAGESRFGIDWQVLAALMYVESKFGRVRSTSTAGAQGPMQFIPSTWSAYGMGGDIQDPHDAVLGAANYLRASGAPADYRRALYAYNHAWPYVDAVLVYAHRMMHDRRAFYDLYSWQVFVLTTSGAVRLTGPGL